MIDKDVRRTIESFVWDCTIGSGRAEELDLEPEADAVEALSRTFGRALTVEELDALSGAWARCAQEACQP